MQSNTVFRQVSLERLSSPEQLDQIVYVTNPKSWLVLIALIALLVTAVIWSIVGRIPVEVASSAILLNNGGVKNIVSVEPGQITALHLKPGQIVEQGQLIAEITPSGSAEMIPIYSPYNGRILELKADIGNMVNPGVSLASLEFVGEEIEREVIMYVSPTDGKRIQPGMTARIVPATVQVEKYGFLLGQVESVSEFPATYAGILRTLGSQELMQELDIIGAPIEVRITLFSNKQTPSGYQWSSSNGPDFTINSGTLASAKIIVENQRPINLVLPLK